MKRVKPTGNPFTLQRTSLLYLFFALFVTLPGVYLLVMSPQWYNFWCGQFDMPEYEKQFGFRMGPLEVTNAEGGDYSTWGITRVEPGGAFARSGLRAGDIPRMYHGVGDLCAELAAAEEGGTAKLQVANVEDMRQGKYDRRDVTVQLKRP